MSERAFNRILKEAEMQRKLMLLVIVVLLLLAFVSVARATQPSGPVTIETVIDFSTVPFSGTFEVTEGTALLGCSEGTFVDIPHSFGPGAIQKIFTCDSGGNGTFAFTFVATRSPGPGDLNGRWTAWKATGDFVGLRGQGDFFVVFPGPPLGEETLSGTIHFEAE